MTVVQASPGAEWERDSLQSLSKTGSLLFTAGRTYHAGIETLALCCVFFFLFGDVYYPQGWLEQFLQYGPFAESSESERCRDRETACSFILLFGVWPSHRAE